ncbi:hypothetical protein V5799_026428 [Amblyomma americanum]|uniref:RING-type domain-containing protein n=1 Tax=Amblyomma americanum TaxID=6943 RepID=A0AAQ4DIK9_AMBAM
MQYTLVGFSTELDWRPLHFVKPIPLHMVCEACGLVRKRTALLPCMHALCESCYEQSARDDVHICPLDGHQSDVDEVSLREFPVDELLRREVKCWNEGTIPTGSMQYTLVGFSAELDWRPLHFVKPIPSYRVCCACGLVRQKTALLSCSHTLCVSCYELSAQGSVCVCPRDGHHCDREDVELKKCPDDEVLKRKVKCWNEGSGCKAVLPASQITQHFHRECRHHSIRCPKCSAAVLSSEVWAHLESECCTTTATPAGSECQGDSGRKEETALLTSFRKILQEQIDEIKTFMERILTGIGANSDGLNEVAHWVNNCQETLRGELKEAISNLQRTVRQEGIQVRTERRDCGEQCCDEVAAVNEETKERRSASKDARSPISESTNALDEPLRDDFAKMATEKSDKCLQTAEGSEMLTDEVEESSIPSRERPTGGRAPYTYCSLNHISVEDLIRDGYVEDDQLRVKFEFLT